MAKKKPKQSDNTIVVNKKARHDYFLQDSFEAGLELRGWEVKALRQGKVQLVDSHVIIKDGQAWLLGAHIIPLASASSHVIADPTRTRRLLLHRKEIAKLFSGIAQEGYTAVCTKIYWKRHLIKCQVALAKGKQKFDKRAAIKEREWNIDKQRAVRHKIG